MEQRIVDAAEEVHDVLGPGCSESTYHRATEAELSKRGISFSSEGTVPIYYKGLPVGKRRPDLFVDDGSGGQIIVELKAGNTRGQDQLFNYMSILDDDCNFDISGGILIRFNDKVEVVLS